MGSTERRFRPGPTARQARPADLCIVRPSLSRGGADRVTVTLLRELDRKRLRPRLALMRATGTLLAEVPADVPIHDLGAGSLWTAWWPLARLLRRSPPEILLSTSGGANLIAVVARLLCGHDMRLVLSERNVLYRDQGRLKRWLQARLKRWLYPRADCVTAVSRGVAEDLTRRLGLPPERVRVLYNPVVAPEIAELAAADLPHPWFAGELPVVLGVGRLVPAKGFDLLLEAFACLAAPARLVLLGEGPQRPALGRQARQLGIAERVWLAGYDSNPFRYMARCTVYVLSSRHEGLPGALIQAMACGAPAIATDCAAGPAEIITHGESGLLVPAGDVAALGAGIERLLGDAAGRRAMAARGRAAVERFTTEKVVPEYLRALLGERADP